MYRRHLMASLLIAVIFAVFAQVRNHGFVWDDGVNIYENPYLNRMTLSNVAYFWKQPYHHLYIPVTYTVWAMLARFAELPATDESRVRLNPRIFHVANLIVHALGTMVVFAVLRMLVRNDWGAFGGGLLFALHPVQVEPVAWVTGMKDVLGGFLSLVAVWQYLTYATTAVIPTKESAGKRVKSSLAEGKKLILGRPGLHYALATLAFVLSLLVKPTAVVVPAVAWVLDRCVLMRPAKQSAMPLIGWLVAAAPIVVVNKLAQPGTEIAFITPLWARPLVAGDAIAFYLYKLALPVWLSPDYGRSPEFVLGQGWIYLTWIIPCGLAVVAWSWKDRRPWLAASAGIFVVGVLPVSGLIPFGFQDISTVADRYLYLSMLGVALAFAWFLAESSRRLVAVACALILGFLAVFSAFQTQYWRDERSLFSHALRLNPKSWMAHNNLGVALAKEGMLEESISHYQEALRIRPDYADAHNSLGFALVGKGEFDKGIGHLRLAVQIRPADANAHNNLGVALAKRGGFEEAIKHYRLALRSDPIHVKAHNNLGRALVERGESEEALKHFRQAIEINPSYAASHNGLGLALAMRGDLERAKGHLRRAVELSPANAEAHNDLGNILTLQGEFKEAIEQYRRALELDPALGEINFNLGVALAKGGQIDEAARHFEAVLKARPDFAPAYYYLGGIAGGQGDPKKAMYYFREALRIQPKFAEAHESLAQALGQQGKKEEAARHYLEARRILESRRQASPPDK